ncbi:MAG: exodeoxyribonuclease VII small subunit [Ruminococcus sp.]|nr:exodeoxyribonuclease VII small subunit [Ruminococcus sp.]
MKFEQGMEKLEDIIEKLESGKLTLEETVELYKSGNDIIAKCKAEIEKARQVITVDGGGNND